VRKLLLLLPLRESLGADCSLVDLGTEVEKSAVLVLLLGVVVPAKEKFRRFLVAPDKNGEGAAPGEIAARSNRTSNDRVLSIDGPLFAHRKPLTSITVNCSIQITAAREPILSVDDMVMVLEL